MGSVSSSLNPGVANLLQTLSSVNSPILSSQTTVNALEKAPAADLVQLSEEATQLEGVDTLFGISSSSASSVSNMDTLLGVPATSTTSPTNILQQLQNEGATLTPSEQAASDQALAQSALTQGLFGTPLNLTGTLFNTLG